jgi:hypothetical protein
MGIRYMQDVVLFSDQIRISHSASLVKITRSFSRWTTDARRLFTTGEKLNRTHSPAFGEKMGKKLFNLWHIYVLGSIVVSIPACHAGDRGSIPRRGVYFLRISKNWCYSCLLVNNSTTQPQTQCQNGRAVQGARLKVRNLPLLK